MTKTPRLNTERRREFAVRCFATENIRAARVSPKVGRPWSLRKVADMAGVSAQFILFMERGERLPRYRKALKMKAWIEARMAPNKEDAR